MIVRNGNRCFIVKGFRKNVRFIFYSLRRLINCGLWVGFCSLIVFVNNVLLNIVLYIYLYMMIVFIV